MQKKEGFIGKDTSGGPAEPMGEQLVAQGASLIRLENTTQIQISMQHPRDEAKILGDALKELDLYPSMADEVLYSKPVGKDATTGKMKYAEGLSVRTAESLANRWKNSAYGCEITGVDEEGADLSAVFLDYENNTRHVLNKRVSRAYKDRNGAKKYHPPDRFSDVVIPANQSKLLREVILRSLPAGLKQEYEDKARQILGSGDAKKRSTKLVAGFMRLGVSKSKLEELAGKKVEDLTAEEITELIGVGNAIRDGETTAEQLIVEKTAAEKLTERMGAGAKVSDAMKQEYPADDLVKEMVNKVAGPDAQKPTESATPTGLLGDRLKLYETVAELAAGDLLEMNAILSKLSAGVITDKQTLLAADDAMVASVIKKMNSSKKG